jgi:hypothetical protein
MCLSCGCDIPFATHQDPRNITLEQLEAAADAVGISPLDAASNIARCTNENARSFQWLNALSYPIVSIDCDGTLNLVLHALAAAVNARCKTQYTYFDMVEFKKGDFPGDQKAQEWARTFLSYNHGSKKATKGFYRALPPDWAAIAAVRAMYNAGVYVHVSTHRDLPLQKLTEWWLSKWQIPYHELHVGDTSKERLAEQCAAAGQDVIFVDDSPRLPQQLANYKTAFVYLLRRPNTKLPEKGDNYCIVDTWRPILTALGVTVSPLDVVPQLYAPIANKSFGDPGNTQIRVEGGRFGPAESGDKVTGGMLHTSDMAKAIRWLTDGQKVDFYHTRDVSTLLNVLADKVQVAAILGDKAPNINIEDISIKGENIFAHSPDLPDIPRDLMPQFTAPADQFNPDSPNYNPATSLDSPAGQQAQAQGFQGEINVGQGFLDHMTSQTNPITGQSFEVEHASERADYLRPSQQEINGVKVGNMYANWDESKVTRSEIVVSGDNYILDGHNLYAVRVAQDFQDNVRGGVRMDVARINAPIGVVLWYARQYATDMGLPTKSGAETSTKFEWLDELLKSFGDQGNSQGRDEHGRFTEAQVIDAVTHSLTDDLRRAPFKGSTDCLAGHCYVASEAAYHMLGGKAAGYTPMHITVDGVSHWYLRGPNGNIDITGSQFGHEINYADAKGKGFLTAQPSERAQTVISRANASLMASTKSFGDPGNTQGRGADGRFTVADGAVSDTALTSREVISDHTVVTLPNGDYQDPRTGLIVARQENLDSEHAHMSLESLTRFDTDAVYRRQFAVFQRMPEIDGHDVQEARLQDLLEKYDTGHEAHVSLSTVPLDGNTLGQTVGSDQHEYVMQLRGNVTDQTLIHEAAHVVAAEQTGYIGHGESFRTTYASMLDAEGYHQQAAALRNFLQAPFTKKSGSVAVLTAGAFKLTCQFPVSISKSFGDPGNTQTRVEHGEFGAASGGTKEWKPRMTPEEGHAWCKAVRSKYQDTVVHITRATNIGAIEGTGFHISVEATHENGVYVATDPLSAEMYSYKGDVALSAVLNLQNPLTVDLTGKEFEGAWGSIRFQEAALAAAGVERPTVSSTVSWSTAVTEAIKQAGYDSVIIRSESPTDNPLDVNKIGVGGNQIVAFNPQQVVVIGEEPLKLGNEPSSLRAAFTKSFGDAGNTQTRVAHGEFGPAQAVADRDDRHLAHGNREHVDAFEIYSREAAIADVYKGKALNTKAQANKMAKEMWEQGKTLYEHDQPVPQIMFGTPQEEQEARAMSVLAQTEAAGGISTSGATWGTSGSNALITLFYEGRNEMTLAHEVAHAITMQDADSRNDGHGRYFQSIYTQLLTMRGLTTAANEIRYAHVTGKDAKHPVAMIECNGQRLVCYGAAATKSFGDAGNTQIRVEGGRFGPAEGYLSDLHNPITASEVRGTNSQLVTPREYAALQQQGQALIDQATQNATPPNGLEANWAAITHDSYIEVQRSWGGMTIDAHTGEPVTASPTGDGPYSVSAKSDGQQSIILSEKDASNLDNWRSAMDYARDYYHDELSRAGAALGVFHDDDKRTVEIDPVLVVGTREESDAIGTVTHAVGGAYNFADGNGYYAPHVYDGSLPGGYVETHLGAQYIGPGSAFTEQKSFAYLDILAKSFGDPAASVQKRFGDPGSTQTQDERGRFTPGMAFSGATHTDVASLTAGERKGAIGTLSKALGIDQSLSLDEKEAAIKSVLDARATDAFNAAQTTVIHGGQYDGMTCVEAGARWYNDTLQVTQAIADEIGLPVVTVAAAIGMTSAMTAWQTASGGQYPNLENAYGCLMEGLNKDGDPQALAHEIFGGSPFKWEAIALAQDTAAQGFENAAQVADAELTGDKRCSFATNILDPNNPDPRGPVTIDR